MIIFEHPDVVSGVSFFTGLKTNYFASGALDGGLRVWNILKKSSTPLQIERISDPISAL
jgi:WD40 repeat protein